MPKTVAVAMIVKNEEVLLARCLNSVKGLPIYILDTGSKDRTVEIARQYTDKVFLDFVWCDDFSAAQNHIKSKVTEDWILSVDADEVLLCSVEEVLQAAELGQNMVRVAMLPETPQGPGLSMFAFGRLFRNSPDIFWVSSIHKHLNLVGDGELVGDVQIMFGRSPAHDLDPDRSLRMLERAVANKENYARNLYYLGREYFYKERYQDCIDTFTTYFPESRWPAELADAYLITANAYLELAKLDPENREPLEQAAAHALQALKVNPNFKEASLFMAAITRSDNRIQWERLARGASNEDVLWKRPGAEAERSDDVIVLAPHQDDETLFCAATLLRYRPLVVSITDSYIQPARGEVGCDADTRRKETIEAMKIAGCPVVFLGIKDTELTEDILRERLKDFNPARVYAPAIQGGNAQHDMVGKVAKELFGDRCELYTTYTKTELYTTGNWEIKLSQAEKTLKTNMLNCYTSQLSLMATHPHFIAMYDLATKEPKSEWLM